MSNGVLCFANNNEINYIKQAEQLAIRIKKYMGLPLFYESLDNCTRTEPIWPDFATLWPIQNIEIA